MKIYWQLFLIIEALLLLVVLGQLFNNFGALFLVILAVITLLYVFKKERRNSFNQFQIVVSVIVLLLMLLINSPAFWIMLVIAIVFLGLKGFELTGSSLFGESGRKNKEIIMVETIEPENKNGRRFKRKWFGNQRIGDTVYEWDDINMTIISGDTLVDLGNTLLPKEDNVILIRKAFGRTRLLVPVGIGVMIEHSALTGNVKLDNQVIKLKNDAVKVYSDDYSQTQRRLKVVSTTFVGDLEVIRI
ncbi:cell wall-active antibiotics response protein [Vagococcus coleopterorum]|uniref:Cell wall-active antibiotics response protein n=1 Tax=Vagococcus coleopterorum TaxID=2714946 RepID=A0A6G8AMN5_9ENTE|nr:cell wall-active antibiotics response protein LiaF [Vagococcus coleopterorum]QIL46328.1 cell wall-active antibiotics response protein [Vagococcus coleopterorum]